MTEGPDPEPEEDWEPPPVPFSFKLTMVLLAIYLGWRVVQLVLCVPSLFAGTDCQWL